MSLFRNKIVNSYMSLIEPMYMYFRKKYRDLSSLMKNSSSFLMTQKGSFSLKFRKINQQRKKVEKRFSDDLPLPLTNFHATLRTE